LQIVKQFLKYLFYTFLCKLGDQGERGPRGTTGKLQYLTTYNYTYTVAFVIIGLSKNMIIF